MGRRGKGRSGVSHRSRLVIFHAVCRQRALNWDGLKFVVNGRQLHGRRDDHGRNRGVWDKRGEVNGDLCLSLDAHTDVVEQVNPFTVRPQRRVPKKADGAGRESVCGAPVTSTERF